MKPGIGAAAELPALRAIASADLHNLVFRSDYRIVPAIIHSFACDNGIGGFR